MEQNLRWQSLTVLTGSPDQEGVLALADGQLVAVLVRLADESHGERVGAWFVEAGFGACAPQEETVFGDLDDARDWLLRRLGG